MSYSALAVEMAFTNSDLSLGKSGLLQTQPKDHPPDNESLVFQVQDCSLQLFKACEATIRNSPALYGIPLPSHYQLKGCLGHRRLCCVCKSCDWLCWGKFQGRSCIHSIPLTVGIMYHHEWSKNCWKPALWKGQESIWLSGNDLV